MRLKSLQKVEARIHITCEVAKALRSIAQEYKTTDSSQLESICRRDHIIQDLLVLWPEETQALTVHFTRTRRQNSLIKSIDTRCKSVFLSENLLKAIRRRAKNASKNISWVIEDVLRRDPEIQESLLIDKNMLVSREP